MQVQLSLSFGPRAASGEGLSNSSSSDNSDEGYNDLLLSGQVEVIHLHNFTGTIREGVKENSRFYFNNIFLNLEGVWVKEQTSSSSTNR